MCRCHVDERLTRLGEPLVVLDHPAVVIYLRECPLREKRDTNQPIRVLLADDHTMFRKGLAGILASHEGMDYERLPETAEAMIYGAMVGSC